MSNVFQDSKDRAWAIKITFGAVKRVKNLTGVNLARPGRHLAKDTKPEELMALPEEEQPLYFRLVNDPILLVDVIYALVQPQAEEKQVNDEEFGSSVDPKVFNEMSEVFWKVYHDFFLEAGDQLNGKIVEQVRRSKKLMAEQAERIGSRIDDLVENQIQKAIDSIETTIQ